MPNAIDLFCGCGGITQGLKQAGFRVLAGVEFSHAPAEVYRKNHPEVRLFEDDIRKINIDEFIEACKGEPIHVLAGCPPCQGFSSIRRKNKAAPVDDPRNTLAYEYLKFVEALKPYTILFENVPSIANYPVFVEVRERLISLGYDLDYRVVDCADYGVPQRRKRFVMLGSRIGRIGLAEGKYEKSTVRDYIGSLETPEVSRDESHRIYAHHTPHILEMITKVPKDGGSRADLPEEYILECHKRQGIGFRDVYGRLRWDDVSSTITGGCLNPSKGRFLHPEQDRALTAREAAILQTFPKDYVFPKEINKTALALMIGNAVPPMFASAQARHIKEYLDELK